MAEKAITGGGVSVPIRADTSQLKQDLAQAENTVSQAGQRMRQQATVSISGASDLGPAAVSATRGGNVQARIANLRAQNARRQERMLTDNLAKNQFLAEGMPFRDRDQIAFERFTAERRVMRQERHFERIRRAPEAMSTAQRMRGGMPIVAPSVGGFGGGAIAIGAGALALRGGMNAASDLAGTQHTLGIERAVLGRQQAMLARGGFTAEASAVGSMMGASRIESRQATQRAVESADITGIVRFASAMSGATAATERHKQMLLASADLIKQSAANVREITAGGAGVRGGIVRSPIVSLVAQHRLDRANFEIDAADRLAKAGGGGRAIMALSGERAALGARQQDETQVAMNQRNAQLRFESSEPRLERIRQAELRATMSGKSRVAFIAQRAGELLQIQRQHDIAVQGLDPERRRIADQTHAERLKTFDLETVQQNRRRVSNLPEPWVLSPTEGIGAFTTEAEHQRLRGGGSMGVKEVVDILKEIKQMISQSGILN